MTDKMNRQILLVERPTGMPTEANFTLTEASMPTPQDGEVLVRTLYLSVDPYMRSRMNDAKSYVPPFKLNDVIIGGVVGEIVESKNPAFSVGEKVMGYLGWADYSISTGKDLTKIPPIAPPSTALGVLGMPGLTAYFGLLEIGKPQEGETVVVSGAAGAVGTIVGQIAKTKGCRVVGIAGSAEKIAYLTEELGFDAAINYKDANWRDQLREACPNGVDVYFDNVGGEITDAVLTMLNFQARISLCGQISLYNLEKPDRGPRFMPFVLIKSATMTGFIVSNYEARFPEGIEQLGKWVASGQIKYSENIIDGLENTPQAFLGLFHGENIGKQLVKVAE